MDGFKKSSILLCCLFTLSACGTAISSQKEKSGTYFTGNENNGDPTAPSDGGSGDVVDAAGFFVKMVNASTSSDPVVKLHVGKNSSTAVAYGSGSFIPTDIDTSDVSTECKISDGASYTDMICVMEIEELDLFFSDITLQIHVPSDMCSYLKQTPYSFYAFEPGNGPTVVSWEVLTDGSITDETNASNTVPQCLYDTTLNDGIGADCCLGSYTQTIFTQQADGTFTSAPTTHDWTGKASNCLDGPAMNSQTKDSKGFPTSDMFFVEGTGKNFTYTIPHAMDRTIGNSAYTSNLYAANFYKKSEHDTNRPRAMRLPTQVTTSTEKFTPNDAYTWSCLDRAEEVEHVIRLFIREWDEDPIAANGDPDSGFGGATDANGDILDDRNDWRDIRAHGATAYPASYL